MATSQKPRTSGGEAGGAFARKRTFPATLLAALLFGQALGFFFLGAFHALFVDIVLEFSPGASWIHLPLGLRSLAFLGLGILALLASAGFFRLWASAWLNAIMVQGLSLLMALGLYLREKPFYAYLMMLCGIFMVLYLNYSEIITAFRSERKIKDWGGVDES